MTNLGARQRPDRLTGANEHHHSFVASGTMSWDDDNMKKQTAELVFAPRKIDTTTADQIGTALVDELERHVFGMSLEGFISQASHIYGTLDFNLVGDSFSSNIALSGKLQRYVHDQCRTNNMLPLSSFEACSLHQLARIVVLILERHKMSASLYSISRLNTSSVLSKKVWKSIELELPIRFRYHAGQPPPAMLVTSDAFRTGLIKLLVGVWDGHEIDTTNEKIIQDAFNFFNGNLADEDCWDHWCCGCHKSKQEALNEAMGSAKWSL
jgi:hypothetical protein